MGNSLNTAGKRIFDDVYSFPQDSQDIANDVFDFANVRVGTNAARLALTPGYLRDGLTWVETDTRNIFQYFTAKGWMPFSETQEWVTLTPASGWVAATTGSLRYRRRGNFVEVLPAELQRTGSTLAINAGTSVTVATLPPGFRPSATVLMGSGSMGVAGNLGASRWFVDPSGNIFFQSLVTNGTMATGGGIGNNVLLGSGAFEAAP